MAKKIVVENGVAREEDESDDDLAARARDEAAWKPPTDDERKEARVDAIQEGVLLIGLELENRIGALEGRKKQNTLEQFKAYVKAKLK